MAVVFGERVFEAEKNYAPNRVKEVPIKREKLRNLRVERVQAQKQIKKFNQSYDVNFNFVLSELIELENAFKKVAKKSLTKELKSEIIGISNRLQTGKNYQSLSRLLVTIVQLRAQIEE